MNKLRFFMFLFLTGCMNLAMAQWQPTPLPSTSTGNHSMYSVVISGTRILTATSNGVYLSDDEGAHWQMSNNGIGNPATVNYLLLKGSTLILGTSGGSIYTSVNNGNSWQYQSTLSAYSLQSLATKGSSVYALANNHVYASTDQVSWNEVTNNLSGNLGEMIAKGSDLFVISNNGQIHRSTDNAASWQSASNGLPVVPLYSLTTDGTTLWVGTRNGVYKSIDNGDNWTSTWSGLPTGFSALEVASFSNNLLMASAAQMLYVSADAGNTWTPAGNFFSSNQVIQFAEYNAKVFAIPYLMGVYASADQGNSWTQLNNGIGIAADKVFITNGQLYIRGSQSTHASSDEGLSWNMVTALPQGEAAGVSYQDGSRIWLGAFNGLYYSDDNASSWTKVSGGGIPATNFGVEAITKHNNTFYIGSNLGVLSSTDGVNWSTYVVNTNVTDLIVFNNKLYAVSGYKLYESLDGQSWTLVSSLSSQTIVGLKIANNKLYIHGIGLYVTSDGNAYTTLSYGENGNITAMAVYNDALILCTYSGNVYVSQNEGVTWSAFKTGLPQSGIRSIAVTDHYLILAKDSPWELYRRPLTDIVPCAFAASITGPASVCAGQTAVSYSVPAQAGVTYSWQVSPSATLASASNGAAISVDFTNTDATITLIQTSAGCAKTLTLPVTVTELGGVYAYGTSNICAGTTRPFYANLVIPGATYNWTITGDAVISSGQGTSTIQLAVGTGNGTMQVVVSKNGCTSTSGTTYYYLRGAPEFFPQESRDLCAGTLSTFLAQGKYLQESYFTWTAPNGYVLYNGQGNGYQQVMTGTVSGQVTVSANNECGTSVSPQVWQINIVPPLQTPVITGPAEVTEGESVTFSVPTQPGVHYFEWTLPAGAVITSGEGTNTIVVTYGATSGNVGVTLHHVGCSPVSATYAVTVSTVVRPTASIRAASVCGGYTAEFFNLSGTFPLTVVLNDQTQNAYTFVLNSANDNIRILPANKTYTIHSVTGADAVTAVATGMTGTITTGAATLNINPLNPTTASCVLDLSVGGTGGGSGVYEWYRIVNGQMTAIGHDDHQYYANKSGFYMATFTTSAGCVKQSPLVDVTINNPLPDLPAITPAGPLNVSCGQAVNITLTATSGYPYYKWYRNGGLIANTTPNQNTYIATTAGTYSVAVSNDNVCYTGTWGTDVVITQTVKPAKPVLNVTGGVFVPCGLSTSITVTNLDPNVYNFGLFKWYKNGVLIAGANAPSYTITDAGVYTVQGSKDGACYSDLSAQVSAQIQPNNGISIRPSTGSLNIPCGSTMDLTATSGYAFYNWYIDGVLITTTHTNVLAAITQPGRYEVESVGANCTSLRAVLNITAGSTSSVMNIVPPSLINVACTQSTTLRSSTTANYYRWYKDGVLIPSATASTYVVTQTGDYTLSGSSDGICYSMPGPPVRVNVVLTGVTSTISTVKAQISCGEKAQLNAMPSTYAYYKWYLNGQLYQTTNVATLNTNDQGTYTVAMSNDNSCYSAISSSTVAVTLNAQPAALQINNGYTSFTYTLNNGNNQLYKTGVTSGNFESYQWQSTADYTDNNWTDIPGATNVSYNFTNANLRYRLKGMFTGCVPSYSNAVSITLPQVMVDIFPAMGSIMCTAQAKLTATPGYQQYTWTNTTTNTVIGTTTIPEISLASFGQATGMYRVTASGVDLNGVQYSGTSMARSAIVVNDITPVLNPPVLACSSASGYITISSPSGSYASYQWSNTSGGLGTTKELLVQDGGTYTLTVTDFAGCTATVSTTVTESAAGADYTPVLTTQSGSTSFCHYSSTVITVANIASLPVGSYQYKWYKDGQFHSTTSTSTLSVTQTGQYSVQIIPIGATNICIGYSNTLNLINYPAVNTTVTGPTGNNFCIGQGQMLTAASGTGYSYAWGTASGSQLGYPSFIFTAIAGATQQTYTPTMNQNLSVKITDANGCIAYSTPNAVQMVPMPSVPVIYQQVNMSNTPAPATITTCSTSVVLSAVAAYGQQPLYPVKWYKDGVAAGTNTTLTVTTSGTYTLEFINGACTKTSTPVVVNFGGAPSVTYTVQNGTISGTDIQICSVGQSSLVGPVAPQGKTYSYKWFILTQASQYIPGGNTPYTSNTLPLNVGDVNKVIILEVTDGLCRSSSQAYTLRVTTSPLTQPSVAAGNACGQSVVTFTAVGTLQSFWKYRWTDAAGNTVQESTSNTFTTPVLNTTTTYYVAYVNGVCASSQKTAAVANITIPPTPVVQNASRCGTGTVTLNASGNAAGTYNWYDNQTGGAIASGASYTTGNLTTGRNYYVASSVTVSGQACLSARVPVSITIKNIPVVTTSTTNLALCSGSVGSITATGADTYAWKQGNTLVATTSTYSTTTLTSTNYTVEGTTNGCTSAPVSVSVTVNPLPVITITSSAGISVCSGTRTTLTATGLTSYNWYTPSALTGTLLGQSSTLDVTPTANITYEVRGTNAAGCSNTKSLAIQIVQAPVAPVVVSTIDLCYRNSVVIPVQNDNPSYTYRWYKNGSSTPVYTGNTYTEFNVIVDFTIEVDALIPGTSCTSTRGTVSVNSVVRPAAPLTQTLRQCGTAAIFSVPQADPQLKYNWYTAAKDGNLVLADNKILVVPNMTQGVPTTYYAEAYRVEGTASCKSIDRSPITVTLNPVPVVTTDVQSSYCLTYPYAMITASGAATYTWGLTNVGNKATIVVPRTAGSYATYVTGTTAEGCQATKQISFTVYPAPNFPTITFDDNCAAGPIMYRANTNILPGYRYTWKEENAAGVITTLKTSTNYQDNTLSHVPVTRSKLTVEVTNSYGCSAKSNPMTLNNDRPTAMKFDGTDDKVTLNMTTPRLKLLAVENKSFGIGFKISADALQSNSTATIVSKRNKVGDKIYGYALFLSNGGKNITLQIDGYDYTAELQYSVYGQQCASYTVSVIAVSLFPNTTVSRIVRFYSGTTLVKEIIHNTRSAVQFKDTPLIIGNDNVNNHAFRGKIYDVSIWGHALDYWDRYNYDRYSFTGEIGGGLALFEFRDSNPQTVTVNSGTEVYQAYRGNSDAVELSDPSSICSSFCTYYPEDDRMSNSDLEEELSESKPTMTASPNPFDTHAEITLSGFTSDVVSLSLIDLNGVEVWHKDQHPVSEQLTLGDELPSGMYILHAIGNDEVQTIKIIKTK